MKKLLVLGVVALVPFTLVWCGTTEPALPEEENLPQEIIVEEVVEDVENIFNGIEEDVVGEIENLETSVEVELDPTVPADLPTPEVVEPTEEVVE